MTTPYADYPYYIGTYLGTTVSSSDFPSLVLRASANLDRICFNRVAAIILADEDLETIDLIKMAVCAVVDELQVLSGYGQAGPVTSESVGGYSVSYAEGAPATLTPMQRVRQAAATYLDSTGLMFPGFAEGEYSSGPYDEVL